ncbi:hypothetical protein PLESTB_001269000 [Pleodorina starrii]|uniref:Uncharacterized protein n=1 Tax=Pleodorina starrii TaxID=330485 RepID=A0A9W6F607_9CHLO|nr:hypothetical protein PLESTM_000718000 [Pleodorina starrii]GLC57807.1 hypothetical protein PLESTB_001269000 [Pleodorina starrii]GLC75952.1 hypothetical protein PLESTF_001710700 [Pleodorina starrii]
MEAEPAAAEAAGVELPEKRRRGRPRKHCCRRGTASGSGRQRWHRTITPPPGAVAAVTMPVTAPRGLRRRSRVAALMAATMPVTAPRGLRRRSRVAALMAALMAPEMFRSGASITRRWPRGAVESPEEATDDEAAEMQSAEGDAAEAVVAEQQQQQQQQQQTDEVGPPPPAKRKCGRPPKPKPAAASGDPVAVQLVQQQAGPRGQLRSRFRPPRM